MKRFLLLPLLAAFLLLLPSCGKEETEPTEPITTTFRATRDQAVKTAATTAPATTVAETTAPATTQKPASTTAPTTKTAATTKPKQGNIPADTITAAHVNPALSAIQSYVQSEVDALAVTGVGISDTELTLEEGESAKLTVTIEPSNAAHKKCSVSVSNDCARASYREGVVSIVAQKPGSCTLTVTTNNGLHASCDILVTERPEDKPEPTTQPEPTTEPSTEPPEETTAAPLP